METKRTSRRRAREQRMSYHQAAAHLGVDVGHLWRVVKGERQSKRLMARIEAERIVLVPGGVR